MKALVFSLVMLMSSLASANLICVEKRGQGPENRDNWTVKNTRTGQFLPLWFQQEFQCLRHIGVEVPGPRFAGHECVSHNDRGDDGENWNWIRANQYGQKYGNGFTCQEGCLAALGRPVASQGSSQSYACVRNRNRESNELNTRWVVKNLTTGQTLGSLTAASKSSCERLFPTRRSCTR